MKKIISLFKRDYAGNRQVFDEIVDGAEWVAQGEGRATRKWNGTCAMVLGSVLYKRYDRRLTKSATRRRKKGETGPWALSDFKAAPEAWMQAQDPDRISGHWPGWLVVGRGPEDQYFREAFAGDELDGTYELCGPRVESNSEGFLEHVLMPHGKHSLSPEPPRTFEGLRDWFENYGGVEGIVWHHDDGRMVKIKGKDFGFSREATPDVEELSHQMSE